MESSQSIRSRLHLSGVSLPVLVGIVSLFVVACVLMVQSTSYVLGSGDFNLTKAEDVGSDSQDGPDASGDSAADNSEDASGSDTQDLVVFVSGCVISPGVYELPAGARVADAVDAAGGFADGAATDALNLARMVQDGEQVDILSQEEVDAGVLANGDDGHAAVPGVDQAAPGQSQGLVNINTADSSQLQALPGVGEATAEKIIASREQDGPFAAKEDLKRVSGIGDKKYAALEDLITVG